MSHLSSKGNKHFLDATSSMWPLASFFSVSFWPRHQSFSGNTPFRFSATPKHVFLLCRPGGLKKKDLHELYQKYSTRNAACGLWQCLYFYITTTTLHVDWAEASNSRLCDQSAPSVCFVFFACVSGWKGKKKHKENENQSSRVKCHGCVWEKAEYRDFNLILRSYRFLMSTRPSKRIAGTCCHCTLPALLGLRRRLLDQDDTCAL